MYISFLESGESHAWIVAHTRLLLIGVCRDQQSWRGGGEEVPAGPGQSESASLVNGTMVHPALDNKGSPFQLSYHLLRDIGLCFQ